MSKSTSSNTSVFEVRSNDYNNIDLKVKGNGETEIAHLIVTAAAPSSNSDTGVAGEIRTDASYLYVCTATNTWTRTGHGTW